MIDCHPPNFKYARQLALFDGCKRNALGSIRRHGQREVVGGNKSRGREGEGGRGYRWITTPHQHGQSLAHGNDPFYLPVQVLNKIY